MFGVKKVGLTTRRLLFGWRFWRGGVFVCRHSEYGSDVGNCLYRKCKEGMSAMGIVKSVIKEIIWLMKRNFLLALKKIESFDLSSWVTGGTKIRCGIPSNWRIFESNWLNIVSQFQNWLSISSQLDWNIL